MQTLEERDRLFRVSLDCYVDALNGVEQHVLRAFAEKVSEQAASLERQKRELLSDPREAAFSAARLHLSARLKEMSEHIKNRLAGTVELSEILALLTQTTQTLRTSGQRAETRMTCFSRGLEEASQLEDIDAFRERVRDEVLKLGALIQEMREENRQLIEGLESEMTTYRKQLDEAEQRANIDSLTGLPNRRFFESHLHDFLASGESFCLLLLDLTRFKAINDSYGHLAGDEVLRGFAHRLKSALKKEDLAARWGGDEFVVVMTGSMRDAIGNSRILEERVTGTYTIKVEGAQHRVRVGVAIGMAEHHIGDSLQKLLLKADALLYASKNQR